MTQPKTDHALIFEDGSIGLLVRNPTDSWDIISKTHVDEPSFKDDMANMLAKTNNGCVAAFLPQDDLKITEIALPARARADQIDNILKSELGYASDEIEFATGKVTNSGNIKIVYALRETMMRAEIFVFELGFVIDYFSTVKKIDGFDVVPELFLWKSNEIETIERPKSYMRSALLMFVCSFSVGLLISEGLRASETNLSAFDAVKISSEFDDHLTRPKIRPFGQVPFQQTPEIEAPVPAPVPDSVATSEPTSILASTAGSIPSPSQRPNNITSPLQQPSIAGVLRPKLRPAFVASQASITAQAIAQDLANQDAQRIKRLESSNKLAALVEGRPNIRPRGLKSVPLNSNVASVQPSKEPKKTAAIKAAVEPTKKPEPQASRVSTTFSKRSLSLIGVFGTPSNRKVMFRTSGGSIQTKKMGQSIGGWKVVAIGESTVKLVKGSRNKTMRLPD